MYSSIAKEFIYFALAMEHYCLALIAILHLYIFQNEILTQAFTHTRNETEEWLAVDFGMIETEKESMEYLCEPHHKDGAFMRCTQFAHVCHAHSLFLDLRGVAKDTIGLDGKVIEGIQLFKQDEIGAHCNLKREVLDLWSNLTTNTNFNPYSSWYRHLLEHFTELPQSFTESDPCDTTFDKPVILVKLDTGFNLYHRFIDYLSFYITQHINGSFDTDTQVIMWYTGGRYVDFFSALWPVFTNNPVLQLRDLLGQKECHIINETELSLDLEDLEISKFFSCRQGPTSGKSKLFEAFSRHVISRLHVPQEGPMKGKIRVTLLVRSAKKKRTISNQSQLITALNNIKDYHVTVANFSNAVPLLEQIKIAHNSDIMIGVHGAGLTHMMFQPAWAAVFILLRCNDPLYEQLTSLRGLKFYTWTNQSLVTDDMGSHPALETNKFNRTRDMSFAFDVEEFLRIIALAADAVRRDPRLIQAQTDNSFRNEL